MYFVHLVRFHNVNMGEREGSIELKSVQGGEGPTIGGTHVGIVFWGLWFGISYLSELCYIVCCFAACCCGLLVEDYLLFPSSSWFELLFLLLSFAGSLPCLG